MAVPKFRSSAQASAIGGADVVVTKPTGTVDTDIMVAVASAVGQTLSPPGGWTQLFLDASGDFGVWWKRASSEGANYTFVTTGGTGTRTAVVGIATYRDCSVTVSPTIGTVLRITATFCKAANVYPDAGAALAVFVGGVSSASNENFSTGVPTGMKERVDLDRSDGASGATCQINISDMQASPHIGTGDKQANIQPNTPWNTWGGFVVLYQTPIPQTGNVGRGRETLVELTHWDEDLGAEVVKKYSGRGVILDAADFYERRVLNSVEVRQHAADRVAVGGIVATTVSDIVLSNVDNALDEIYRRMLAVGRSIVIKSIAVRFSDEMASNLGNSIASAITVFTGVVAALTPSGQNMVVTVSDLGERLNVPLHYTTDDEYDGSSGVGGGSELKGQTKPLTFGRCYNVWPQELGNFSLGDGALYTYQAHSRSISAVSSVYERGVAMADSGGVAPIAGQYRAWVSSGVFQLGFTPNGIVTCTVKGDDPSSDIYANQHGEIVNRMLTHFGPRLSSADLELTTFTDVDTVLPGEIGIHFPSGDRTSARDAIERVLRSGGVWLSGGRNGKFRLAMAMPSPTERLTLTQPDIVALRPVALPAAMQPAPHIIDVETEINWHPLTDISSSVTGGTRRKLAGPGRTVHSISTALQTRQKTTRTWSMRGLWFDDAQGLARADQIRTWIESGLLAFEVSTDRYVGVVELGMSCELESYPLFGLDGGFSGIVCGWREQVTEGRVTMSLIGSVS